MLPQDLHCMFPKCQSWGKAGEEEQGGLCPKGKGQDGWEAAEGRGFGAGEELRGAAASSLGLAVAGAKGQSHVQPCPAVPGACRDSQVAPGDLGMEQEPSGRCCSSSSGFGDIKADL